jgi:hypothetical protein
MVVAGEEVTSDQQARKRLNAFLAALDLWWWTVHALFMWTQNWVQIPCTGLNFNLKVRVMCLTEKH